MNANQKAVYVLLAEGFETLEALTVVDVLRRAAWPVYTVSATASLQVISGQHIPVTADMFLKDLPWAREIGILYIPGGLPAAKTLSENEKIMVYIQECEKEGALIASLCAGPLSLESAGLAKRYRGTCFPGVEETVQFKEYLDLPVVDDGQVISSRGPATAMYLALHLLERLAGKEAMKKVKDAMQQSYVEKYYFK